MRVTKEDTKDGAVLTLRKYPDGWGLPNIAHLGPQNFPVDVFKRFIYWSIITGFLCSIWHSAEQFQESRRIVVQRALDTSSELTSEAWSFVWESHELSGPRRMI